MGPTRSVSLPKSHGRLCVPEGEITAHAGGEIDDHVGIGFADALHHLPVKGRVPGTDAGLGIPDMAMGDSGARPGRLQSCIGDLFGCHRKIGMLTHGVAGTGNGTADKDFEIHGLAPSRAGFDFALDRAVLASPAQGSLQKSTDTGY